MNHDILKITDGAVTLPSLLLDFCNIFFFSFCIIFIIRLCHFRFVVILKTNV